MSNFNYGQYLPKFIPDVVLHLDANDVGTVIPFPTNDSPVSQWDDLSGKGYNASQGTAVNQPLYKTNIQNGLNGIYFDGINDYLTISDTADLQINNGAGKQFTLAVCYKINSVSPPNTQVIVTRRINNSVTTDWAYFETVFSPPTTMYWGTGTGADAGAWWAIGGAPAVGNANYNTMTLNQTGSTSGHKEFYEKGVREGSGTNYSQKGNVSATIYIGFGNAGGTYLKGWIFEIVVIKRVLQNSERLQLEQYFANKWGIT